jgi:hypothetical protein
LEGKISELIAPYSVQVDLDLPVIAVIGNQSAGKSSLIEAISGITLPRAAGTCTRWAEIFSCFDFIHDFRRCPTECKLSYSTDKWKCVVSLRFLTDAKGQNLGQAKTVPFGDPILDKSEVEERIRRAQRAILNPSVEPHHFLDGPDVDHPQRQLTFSSNCVSLQISGSEVADLSFVDLPGNAFEPYQFIPISSNKFKGWLLIRLLEAIKATSNSLKTWSNNTSRDQAALYFSR